MIRVLVAEDSRTVRRLLVEILESDPEIRVVGEAGDGEETIEMAERLRPDLITMDVHMPILNGLDATKEIMVRAPTPIVIVSSAAREPDVGLALDATRAGALMILPKPESPLAPDFEERRAELVSMVKAMAQVKVVRRWAPITTRARSVDGATARPGVGNARLVAIATSTGGPPALQRILMDLPRDFPVPILVVQHIADGFVEGLCRWLRSSCNLRVKLAEEGEPLQPRTVYLAADDRHLGVRRNGTVALVDEPPIGGFRPSATYLFESAAREFGAAAIAVILTGMGRDGVEGLHAVHEAGGWVLAQDEPTSAVYGMPREAVRAGVVDASLPLHEISGRLVNLVRGKAHGL